MKSSKSLVFLTILMISAMFVSPAEALLCKWIGPNDTNDWADVNNWDVRIPTKSDKTYINTSTGYPGIYINATAASDDETRLAYNTGNVVRLYSDTYNHFVDGDIRIGYGVGATCTYDISGTGSLSAGRIYVGNGGDGTLNISGSASVSTDGRFITQNQVGSAAVVNQTGGTVSVGSDLMIGAYDSDSIYNLHGGTLTVELGLTFDEYNVLNNSVMDITEGTLILPGADRVAEILDRCTEGHIVAYDGTGGVLVEYVGGDTVVTGLDEPFPTAHYPSPPEGYLVEDSMERNALVLSWWPGPNEADNSVYFSDVWADVNDGTALVSENQTELTHTLLSPLDLDTTYYWRVDSNNTSGVIAEGDIWSFAVRDIYTMVDDMEDYHSVANPVGTNWMEYGGALVFTQVGGIIPNSITYYPHSGYNCVNFDFLGASEIVQTFTSAQDWTAGSINALTLYLLAGDVNNVGSLSIMLGDSDLDTSSPVVYTGDINDVTHWLEWNIALEDFNNNDMDLNKVKSIEIAVDGTGDGSFYIDDVIVATTRCVMDYPGDLNGDCIVNAEDLVMLTDLWLQGHTWNNVTTWLPYYQSGDWVFIIDLRDYAIFANGWLETGVMWP
ncbi:hypothetical protein KAR91_10245 [Candidatus Pacearchaeota archaeon]|nr:hypothetical protein [Candidatus Pacearchaeota archaeon]